MMNGCYVHRLGSSRMDDNGECPVCKIEKVKEKAKKPEVEDHWQFWLAMFNEEIGKEMTRQAIFSLMPFGREHPFLSQLKLELSDYSQLMSSVSKVYDDLTGGRISKPMTDPSAVIGVADEYADSVARENVKDWLVSLDGEIPGWCLAFVRKSAQKHFNIPEEDN